MYILGISCFYHDAAAALIKDGKLVIDGKVVSTGRLLSPDQILELMA